MNVDQARENLSRANTALGDAWRALRYAETHGAGLDVVRAETAWETANRDVTDAERLLVEAELRDAGGWRP